MAKGHVGVETREKVTFLQPLAHGPYSCWESCDSQGLSEDSLWVRVLLEGRCDSQGHLLPSPCHHGSCRPSCPSTQVSGSLPLKSSADPEQKAADIGTRGTRNCVLLGKPPPLLPRGGLILGNGELALKTAQPRAVAVLGGLRGVRGQGVVSPAS